MLSFYYGIVEFETKVGLPFVSSDIFHLSNDVMNIGYLSSDALTSVCNLIIKWCNQLCTSVYWTMYPVRFILYTQGVMWVNSIYLHGHAYHLGKKVSVEVVIGNLGFFLSDLQIPEFWPGILLIPKSNIMMVTWLHRRRLNGYTLQLVTQLKYRPKHLFVYITW